MKKIIAFFLVFSFRSSTGTESQACSLGMPVITQNSVTACAISISWVGDPQTAYYVVRYRLSQSAWQPGVNVGTLTNYIFTELNANTSYVVEVTPYCSNNKKSTGGQLSVTTLSCSLPENIAVTNISDTSATISWQLCGGGIHTKVRYRPQGIVNWQNIPVANSTSLLLSGLMQGTTYEYEVRTCGDSFPWSPLATFKTLAVSKPNILCIYLDDSRYDPFAPDGGPSFFQSPGINRIADEGVRFVYAFPALSLCGPSRASIMTGLYPHHHGVINNAFIDTLPYPTVAQILHDHGYYTGFTGKYGFERFPDITGYDYYCESTSDVYWNSPYAYNGQFHVVIPGHKTDVITSKALEFLNSVPPGKKFLLYVAHKAPHTPYTPRTQDDGIYSDAQIPFPDNFERWTKNVPSYYNSCYGVNNYDTASKKTELEKYYELLAGAEASIDTILTYLENKGILDSTLVIFTSDNGFFIGEHLLTGKEIALEESIRLPMFIRYPKWFAPGTVVSDEMAMNIDIAPTILEAAGIPDTFNMDGMSMRGLVNHTVHRKELLYEYFYRESCNPTITAVRDFNYKYISNRCADTVEEFYDLVNDPKENINLINSPNYSSLIQKYRNKLDSLKQVYGYVLAENTIEPCSLENPDSSIIGLPCSQYTCNISATSKITAISSTGTCNDGRITITPSGTFNFHLHLELYDHDSVLLSSVDPQSDTAAYIFKNLPSGIYEVKVFDGSCCEIDLNEIRVQCPKPNGVYASGISTANATINWANQGCNNGYKVQFRKQGTSSWKTKKTAANVNSYHISGLTANTTYEWKVAAICASMDSDTYSSYSAVQTFTTLLRPGEGKEDSYSALSICPNPAGEIITVTVNAKDAGVLQVKDPMGRIVMEEKISDKSSAYKLNVSSLAAGVYLVSIKTGSRILQEPFVKEQNSQ